MCDARILYLQYRVLSSEKSEIFKYIYLLTSFLFRRFTYVYTVQGNYCIIQAYVILLKTYLYMYFFGELKYVGHSFAYVARFVFLRYV